MNCKEFKKLLLNYDDLVLSPGQSEEFQYHIDSCIKCSILFHKYINTIDLLKPKVEIEEHAFYFTRLKQRMENYNYQNRSVLANYFLKKLIQPAIYLSSLILAVYIGILIGSSSANQNQFSELKNDDTDYIKTYSEYQYINDFEIEPIENLLFENINNLGE